ncbi:MAG: HAMP domain-containing histidine kinase [Caldilineales bacterium]|nr:HAMP domain-containing histidine kinase [Caldilineales bacterium]
MFRSIRWRLVLSYVLLTILTVSIVGVLGLSLLQDAIQRQELAAMQTNADAIASQAEELMWPVVRRDELQNLAGAASFLGYNQVRILDRQRKVIADSNLNPAQDSLVWLFPSDERLAGDDLLAPGIMWLPNLASLLGQLENGGIATPSNVDITIVRRLDGPWGGRLVFESMTMRNPLSATPSAPNADADTETSKADQIVLTPVGSSVAPLGFVEIARQSSLAAEALGTARQTLALSGLLAAGFSIILGLVVGRSLTRPLDHLADAADRMSGGDLSARAPVAGGQELEQLAQQFNDMAAQLERSFADLAAERDALRTFIGDASHELRTPITALRNFNDLLLSAAGEDAEIRAEFLGESKTQIERLTWITQHLLDLSRIDAGLAALEFTDCAAVELIESAATSYKRLAQDKNILLTTQASDPALSLRCDRTRVELALFNLVDNALKFTPAGGEIEIGAARNNDACEFWVQDTGPGVAAADAPHIFARFYHGPDGGSGLGLAIVRSVAQAHGGYAYLDETWQKGSRFVMVLPLSA